ncbi:transcription factor HES-5 [Grus japonensis]|uniref:Transcription factor HES-5 n=1 Tax=Grus japonensis TaxID=30415 RepID=A0ABC9XNF1_GRUJA
MAPSHALMIHMEEKLLPKEKNKLRKPVVEKMRRDRINSSIEQLKLLLEKEFQRHQPNSKLEKADILEVAVSYLKQQSQLQDQMFMHKNLEQDFNSGYLRCLKEAMHFLSYYEPKKETQLRKPIVEKLRRDRINSSIEQLKLLLEKEFQRHQPNSKLEKADILEMTVSYLKYSRAERTQLRTIGP